MAKAGCNSEHCERVLGHIIPGIEATYNRHSYRDEKRIVLEKLATQIEQIISSEPSDKIVPIRVRS
jgi:hypothetical protein